MRDQEIFCGYKCYKVCRLYFFQLNFFQSNESLLKSGFFPNPDFVFNKSLLNNCIKNDKTNTDNLPIQQNIIMQQSLTSPQNSLDEFSSFLSNGIFPSFNQTMALGSNFRGFSSGPGVDGTVSTSSEADSSYSNPDSVAAPSSINSGCGGLGGNALNNSGSCSGTSSSTNGSGLIIKKSKKDKPTQRIRTVLNETQLKILKQMYSMNQRPDTITKETLVERTGLSARVIRVWFQNKRCKVYNLFLNLFVIILGQKKTKCVKRATTTSRKS